MLNIKDKIKSMLKKSSQIEEIFSTSEKKNNIENTNPLNLGKEDIGVMLNGYKPINFTLEKCDAKYSDSSNYEFTAKKISKDVFKSRLILLILIILFLASAAVDITYRFYQNIFNFSSVNKNYLYLYFQGSINIIFLIYTIIFLIKKLKCPKSFLFMSGIAVLFSGVFSFIQCLSIFICFNDLTSVTINAYVSIYCLYVVMMQFNDYFIKQKIKKNMKFINSKKTKYVSGMYEKCNMDNSEAHKFAYRKNKDCINDFFDSSFMDTKLKKIIFILVAFTIFVSIAVLIFCFVGSYSMPYLFSALTILSFMLSPIPFLTVVNSNILGFSKKALRKGAMIAGLYAAQCFSKTDAIAVDASDLYPADNVVLRSIKTFKGQRIDEAILKAAAVVCSIGGPISKVFDKIIMGKKSMLSEPTEVKYEDEMGLVGYIDSQRVLLGNREILKKYKVDPPSRDYEKKYVGPGMEHIYLAMDRDLVAMFVLEYIPNKSLKRCLKNLEKNGILLFVKTTDCNITAEKISKDFYVSGNEVNILNFKTSEQINKIESIKNENPPALLCTFERVSSFMWGLCLSKKMVRRKNIIFMIMTLSLILGCVFSVSLALTGGIDAIKPIELGIYHILWILISILLPKLSM